MRRTNSNLLRFGIVTPWLYSVKVENYRFLTRFVSRVRQLSLIRLNKIQRTQFKQNFTPILFRRRCFRFWLWRRRIRFRARVRFGLLPAKLWVLGLDWRIPWRGWRQYSVLMTLYRLLLRGRRAQAFRTRPAFSIISDFIAFRRRQLTLVFNGYHRRFVTPLWRNTKWQRIGYKSYFIRRSAGVRRLARMQEGLLYIDARSRRFYRSSIFTHAVRRIISGNGLLPIQTSLCIRNTQKALFSSFSAVGALYQTAIIQAMWRFRQRRHALFPFRAAIYVSSLRWRNLSLLLTGIGQEMRRTRFHFRYVKLLTRFLRLLSSSHYSTTNLVLRVRGCFGRNPRTRAVRVRPFFKLNTPVLYQDVHSPIRFAFQRITTYRGVFGIAAWLS